MTLANVEIVARVRALLGLPAGVPRRVAGGLMVPHVADVWGREVTGSLPSNERIPDLAPGLVLTDAADIVVVDWLCDQSDRRGSSVMVLEGGRLAPCDDGQAFEGTAPDWESWIRLPGRPLGLARIAPQDRVDQLGEAAVEIESEFYDWLTGFADDAAHEGWVADIFGERLDALVAGDVQMP